METENTPDREKMLAAEGWARRFSAEEPRLSEMKQLYESLGMEVLVVQGVSPEEESCSACFDSPDFKERYYTIYTRGDGRAGNRGPEEPFD